MNGSRVIAGLHIFPPSSLPSPFFNKQHHLTFPGTRTEHYLAHHSSLLDYGTGFPVTYVCMYLFNRMLPPERSIFLPVLLVTVLNIIAELLSNLVNFLAPDLE